MRFAGGIIVDAQNQPDLVSKAQNGVRRLPAEWSNGSLHAWQTVLKERQRQPDEWDVSSVQAYAQAVLTFVNMLPGTTRTGKSTNGHGEGVALKQAIAAYRGPDLGAREQAMVGNGLFDAGSTPGCVRATLP